MKLLPLICVAALGVLGFGYAEIRYQAERAALRADVARLTVDLAKAEKLAAERGKTLVALKDGRRDQTAAAEELAGLEARILDKAAELALLESDRLVAEERASEAIQDLKKQVHAFAAIETDMTILNQQRHRLKRDVELVEAKLQRAELGAAERQDQVDKLDHEVANLALLRETLKARLETAERDVAARTLETDEEKDPATEVRPSASAIADADAEQSITPAALPKKQPASDEKPRRGLYQFSRLSATPDAMLEEEEPAIEIGEDTKTAAWIEDQYVLGLTLLANAERRSGTRELGDAVLAFKAVLGEWSKDDNRIRWATARSDLGYALALLGKRRQDRRLLDDAAEASRDALGELEREAVPMLWAAAQHHLGLSLSGLADIEEDVELRKEAIKSLEAAFNVFDEAGAAPEASKVKTTLREAYAHLPATLEDGSE